MALPDEARSVKRQLVSTQVVDRPEGGRVGYVTVNNPEKHNALPAEGRRAVGEAMRELSRDPELRCIVLTGEGDKAFIGGANVGEMSEFPNAHVAEEGSAQTHFACDSIRRTPVPVIARIAGYCLGAGMEIATSCDMRIAARNARFGMPEVRFGLPSGMEACLLPRVIGWGKTMELIYTGEMIGAEEAYHFGFVEKLVDLSDLDAATESWVRAIVTAGPRAIRLQKELVGVWERVAIADAVQAGIRAVGRAHLTDEPRRLLTAFKSRKRTPR